MRLFGGHMHHRVFHTWAALNGETKREKRQLEEDSRKFLQIGP